MEGRIHLFSEGEEGASTKAREIIRLKLQVSKDSLLAGHYDQNNHISPGLRGGGVALRF